MKVDRILFIGTGGGNDIFSTTLAMKVLWRQGWRWNRVTIAGVLSPFHMHTGALTGIDGVSITDPGTKRFLNRGIAMGALEKIGCIDAVVSAMCVSGDLQDMASHAPDVLGLSLDGGTVVLSAALKELAATHDYTVLVDIGGDILYRGKEDTHILSPMFDACVLRAARDAGIPCILFEAGLGSDGELDPEALNEVLQCSRGQRCLIHKDDMLWWSELYRKWIAAVRPGRTVPLTIEAYNSNEDELIKEYCVRAHLGVERRYAYFQQRIETKLCRSYFLIDPHKVLNPFAVACKDPEEWFLKTQVEQQHTNNEANLEYMLRGHEIVQFLTPSPLLKESDRLFFIKEGLKELRSGKTCNAALMLDSDLARIPDISRVGFTVTSRGSWSEVRA